MKTLKYVLLFALLFFGSAYLVALFSVFGWLAIPAILITASATVTLFVKFGGSLPSSSKGGHDTL